MRPVSLSRIVILTSCLILVAHSRARAAETPSSPAKRAVVLVRVETSADLSPGVARDLFRQALARYNYSVLGCAADVRDENELNEIFAKRGIRSPDDSNRHMALLKKMTVAGCKDSGDTALFVARMSALNDPQARQRLVMLELRSLTGEVVELSGTASAPFNTPYPELIQAGLDDAMGVKAPPSPWTPRKIAGTAAAIVGAGGVVLGAITGVVLFVKKSYLDSNDDCSNRSCGPAEYGNVDSYNSLRTISTVAFVVGGIGLAAGAVLLRWGLPKGSDVRVAIVPDQTGGVAILRGKF